jgi:DNA helicase-2/ATP-dependent DNA helicase PcrA
MEIHNHLLQLQEYKLNEQQQRIISHDNGPLLVIAGPGSGKTFTIILRTLNLLLLGKATPSQIIICTYTDKAARELQDRLMSLAQKIRYQGELAELRVGTIHGICNQLIRQHLNTVELGNNYEVLDEFSQRLFIFKHLRSILSREASSFFSEKWGNEWQIAQWLQNYLDKITEERVEEKVLLASDKPFLRHLARAYLNYRRALINENRLSFSAQLGTAYKLLSLPETRHKITQAIRYVFVDEYQDINNIQEQIVLNLASATGNLCVVGDEDQAIYRFRGATVRNILEFANKVPECTTLLLTTNYRSHPDIIAAYDRWMATGNWSDGKRDFRHHKTIQSNTIHPDYPSVISLQGKDEHDEAEQLADLILFLKDRNMITDYNQVALLLCSVKAEFSSRYLEALQKRGIPYFCPRARSYFEQEEVRLMVACFAILFHYHDDKQAELLEHEDFARYVRKQCIALLMEHYPADHPLHIQLNSFATELEQIASDEASVPSSDICLMDYFYRLLALEPFATFVKDEKRMHNLVRFSELLNSFQHIYQHNNLAPATWEQVRSDFFSIFLRLQQDEGLNEYEDREQPFPQGHIQIMTIHQAKGLEFPVVIVGSLEKGHKGAAKVDRDLSQFYRREQKEFEPENRIPGFDMMRLYYVAFSRAERLLVLTSNLRKRPKAHFDSILKNLPQWPDVKSALGRLPKPDLKEAPRTKRRYSFTSDLQVYETCPRQYQFFREYQFKPARPREVFLGLLVHQSIEVLHRIILAGNRTALNEQNIQQIVDRTFAHLICTHPYSVEPSVRELAYEQVYSYFMQNRRELQHIIAAEVDIVTEQDGYILKGRVDLLRESNGDLELLDFKTDYRPPLDAPQLVDYERQLCTYAYMFERRYGKRPARLLLYWTREKQHQDAVMELRYRPEVVAQVQQAFLTVTKRIHEKDFQIRVLPEPIVCQRCDMYHYCQRDGILPPL